MAQAPTKISKEDEKLIRLEKKMQKDPGFKKQISDMNKSFQDFVQNHRNQISSINNLGLSKKQIREISKVANEACLPLIEDTKKNELNETNFGLEVLDSGIFKYKGKILSITTNSDPGKFFKQLIEDSNHFVPDTFCFEKFHTPSPNETRGIIQKIKNKFKATLGKIHIDFITGLNGSLLQGIVMRFLTTG